MSVAIIVFLNFFDPFLKPDRNSATLLHSLAVSFSAYFLLENNNADCNLKCTVPDKYNPISMNCSFVRKLPLRKQFIAALAAYVARTSASHAET